MPPRDLIRVFISHAWKLGGDYGRVVQLLYELEFLHWENYSNPKDSGGFFTTNGSRRKKITAQMHPVHAVVIVSDMYEEDKEWVEFELNEAVRMRKPIIVVEPKLAHVPVPYILVERAMIVVPWHGYKLGSAIQSFSIK